MFLCSPLPGSMDLALSRAGLTEGRLRLRAKYLSFFHDMYLQRASSNGVNAMVWSQRQILYQPRSGWMN